jgi:succinate dehydrogenase/fumarate reductase-like Fe-S protein
MEIELNIKQLLIEFMVLEKLGTMKLVKDLIIDGIQTLLKIELMKVYLEQVVNKLNSITQVKDKMTLWVEVGYHQQEVLNHRIKECDISE